MNRRAFLAGSLGLLSLHAGRARGASLRARLQRGGYPFTLGIGSGDPSPSGVVLWTRLALDPLNGGGMPPEPIRVGWEIASDDQMKVVLRKGEATARPEWAHAVHVEVDGLAPNRWYWYRFHAGSDASPIGRTRTLPARGAAVDTLRFSFVSCQNYEMGYFTALQHAAKDDVDLLFHLGDYIYENSATDGRTRRHLGSEPTTLDEYRNRYAQYRMDPDLQAAHAAFPWIVTPDDHEVDNNYAGAISELGDPPGVFLQRRAAAYRAYYEHMPLARASVPRGPSMRLYRSFSYGALAAFFVLDTRQFRTDQPCGDRIQAPCEASFDPAATMMGRAQEQWLFDGLHRSSAGWNILPQQVMMAKVDRTAGPGERYSMDQWPGYEADRTRLLTFLGARQPRNPIVLTGDIHDNWVNDLTAGRDERSPVVATELVGTSVSSGGDGQDMPAAMAGILAENPFVKFYNSQRGYVRCAVTTDRLQADYRVVEYVSRPDAPVITRASFVVENGHPGGQPL